MIALANTLNALELFCIFFVVLIFFHCSAAVKRDSLAITVRPEWTFVRLDRAGMEGPARAGMDISSATAQEDSLANGARA